MLHGSALRSKPEAHLTFAVFILFQRTLMLFTAQETFISATERLNEAPN
jgi:hypothetical protein